ncbi:MAG: hypothetical protein ACXAE3_14665 [Candidatus Kariarchaeaceae archaeon]
MEDNIDIWVCPRCHVLQGIEVSKDEAGNLLSRCVNCGVPLEIDEVKYINQDKASKIIDLTLEKIPAYLVTDVRFSWLSNRTLGIIFECDQADLIEDTSPEIVDFFEDEIGKEMGLTITVYFE